MNNPIYMIAFIFSQLVFFPSYIKCTKLLTGNESSRVKKFIRYFLLSPLSAYILSSFIYTIVGKISPVIRALGGDVVMYIVSFMYLIIYQRIVSKKKIEYLEFTSTSFSFFFSLHLHIYLRMYGLSFLTRYY